MKPTHVILLLLSALIVSCTQRVSHTDPTKPYEIDPKGITSTTAFVIDLRNFEDYAEEHIEGAISLDYKKLSVQLLNDNGLTPESLIVLYDKSGKLSAETRLKLNSLGYTNVKILAGGLTHWKEDGYPTIGNSTYTNKQEYDFGRIPQYGGNATTTFLLKNEKDEPLIVNSITTSCACTSASINTTKLNTGENALITVTFNPNLHAEPVERFSRTIFVTTNQAEIEYKIFVDIKEGE
jgi:rhodanese-related sulfurtransferase